MQKVLSQSLMRLAKKGVSISTLVSLCSSLLTFGAALPASAAPAALAPLTSLTSTISNSKLSDCNPLTACSGSNNPVYEYTNVSYTWQFSEQYAFAGDTECVLNQQTPCMSMTIATDDMTSQSSLEYWKNGITFANVSYSGPANTYVISATPSDVTPDNGNVKETLTILFGCTAACTWATNTVQTLDIVDQPMYTPYKSNFADTNIYHSYPVTVTFAPLANYNGPGEEQGGQTVDNYGGALNVTASIDASLTFQYAGTSGSTFYTEGGANSTIVDSADAGCYFGTLTPNEAKVCLFDVEVETNAPNGFSIYVVQDQNMTFNGNTVKQFKDGTRTDETPGAVWTSPLANTGAHLGYSSNDESVFVDVGGAAVWAGIPTAVSANTAAANPVGLVANDNGPGLSTGGVFALKIEANTSQPQAVSSLGQEYSNNLYFIVVGNF